MSNCVGLGAGCVLLPFLKVKKGSELVVRPFQKEEPGCQPVPQPFGRVIAIFFQEDQLQCVRVPEACLTEQWVHRFVQTLLLLSGTAGAHVNSILKRRNVLSSMEKACFCGADFKPMDACKAFCHEAFLS